MKVKSITHSLFYWFRLLVVIGMLAQITGIAYAAVWTDQADYSPGSVVTISGDNSDGAGYQAGETVHVEVWGPNGYHVFCDPAPFADTDGAWSCQVTLWDNELAVGEYTYMATQQTPNGLVSQSGTFTDAPGLSNISIDDVEVTEGNSGTSTATFTVTVTRVGNGTVSINFATADGTAIGGTSCSGIVDYASSYGTLTWNGGESDNKTISITVCGDIEVETNETFFINLTSGSQGSSNFSDSQGQGTITNDDFACTAPSVTTNPADQSVIYGADATFMAAASGTSPTALWQVSTDGGTTWNDISGETDTSLTISSPTVAQNGYKYRAVFKNTCGTATTDAATLTVNKATATVTLSNLSYTYDGTAKSATAATNPSGLNVVITYNGSPTAPTNAGYYAVVATIDDADYEGSANGTLHIGQASSTVVVSCPASVIYNGSAQTPCTAEATGDGMSPVDVTGSLIYANNTNAGTATANANWGGDDNHTGNTGSGSFDITKAPSKVTMTCPASVVYNGSAQMPCTAEVTGAGGLNQALTVSYSNNTNAGTATASASYTGDANHEGSNGSTTFTIDKAPSTTTVTCPMSVTYDGSALEPCMATVTGAGGLNQSLIVSYSNNVNAGTATASASFDGDVNHEPSSDLKTFTIDKAPSTTTVTCPTNVTYTGSALEPCKATVTGAGGLNQTLTVNYTNNTNAGTATASASFDGDVNHEPSSDTKTFTIDKAPSTTTVTCPASVVYNGSALEPCTAVVTGAGGLNQTLTVNYTNNTNAGTATGSASFDGDVNHEPSSDTKTFTIDKAPSATTVTCPASVVYSGSALEPCTAVVTGAGGLNQSLTVNYSNNINPGANTATASATYAGDANHTGSNDSKMFSILYATDGMCLGSPGHQILQPIDADGWSVFKQKSTVPAKFRVCDANGSSVGIPGVVSSFRLFQVVSGTAVTGVNEEVVSTTPDTAFRWSPTDQLWIFNINTKNLAAGNTYYYRITLNDGSTIEFHFGLK